MLRPLGPLESITMLAWWTRSGGQLGQVSSPDCHSYLSLDSPSIGGLSFPTRCKASGGTHMEWWEGVQPRQADQLDWPWQSMGSQMLQPDCAYIFSACFLEESSMTSLPFVCDHIFQIYNVSGRIEKFRTHDNTQYLLSTVLKPSLGTLSWEFWRHILSSNYLQKAGQDKGNQEEMNVVASWY